MKTIVVVILAGLGCFTVALIDLLTRCPDTIYNWHLCLSAFGWAGTIGFVLCLLWLFAEGLNLIKRK